MFSFPLLSTLFPPNVAAEGRKRSVLRLEVSHQKRREESVMPISVFYGFMHFDISLGNPFLKRTVEGFLKIGAVAASKVAVQETYDCLKKGQFSKATLDDALRKMSREGAYWGTTAGVYVGMEYGMESIRGTRDWKNAMLGGAMTGLLMSAAIGHGRDQVIANAITAAAVATAAELINNLT